MYTSDYINASPPHCLETPKTRRRASLQEAPAPPSPNPGFPDSRNPTFPTPPFDTIARKAE